MSITPFNNIVSALLSMKRALYGMVTPSLRAVTVNLDLEKEIYICHFFYDVPIDEDLFDLASCTAAEASDCWVCDEHFVQLNFPTPIPANGALAFLRKESGMTPPKIQLLPRSEKTIAGAYLSYAMQQGLLGRVIPSLRSVKIIVNEEKKAMRFHFYYDEEITEELRILSKEAITIAKKAFPDTFHSTEEIIFFPCPKRIPSIGGDAVYARNEPTSDD